MPRLSGVIVLGLLAGCAGLGLKPTPHPVGDPVEKGTWKEIKFELTEREGALPMPQAEDTEADALPPTVEAYLNDILALLSASSATPAQVSDVMLGCVQRFKTAHPYRTNEVSWNRVRLAHLHAQEDEWDSCAHKLKDDPAGMAMNGWPAWAPAAWPPGMSIAEMLDDIPTRMGDAGHPQESIDHVERAIAQMPNPPYPGHGEQTAWAHVYLAYQYAGIGPEPDPPGSLVVEWIICELGHDN